MISFKCKNQNINDVPRESDDLVQKKVETESAELMLSKGLSGLFQKACDNISEKMQTHSIPISSQMGQIENKQQQLVYSIDRVTKQFESLDSYSKLLQKACSENRRLTREHYEQCIIQPMIRTLIPVLDMIEDAHNYWNSGQNLTSNRISELIDAVYIQLQQFLNCFGVEGIKHRPNSRFDPQLMKPVKVILSNEKSLVGCIAESLQPGYRITNDNRLLRQESVSIYKYQPPQNETVTLIERAEQC